MANFVTTSITYEGKANFEAILKKLFIGKSPLQTQGIRVMPNIQSTTLLNLFGSASKITKAYTKGFNPATGAAYTRRSINVYQMKAEMTEDGNEFWQTIYEQILGKGVDMNDISKAKELETIILQIFMNAFESDVFRQYWLNDVAKETVTGGIYTGVADLDYNAYPGMWSILFANSALVPTADQIQLFNYADSSVKQVSTVSVTGTSGTANVLFNGINYLATFATDLTTTAANFVTTHATALLLRGVVVTSAVADLIFTSAVSGQPFDAITITNATGDLAGTVAATTANTVPAALTANQAQTQMKAMYVGSNAELKSIEPTGKVFLVDSDTYENYMTTLESQGSSGEFSVQSGKDDLVNGNPVLKYRGVPVVKLEWDVSLNADFPTGRPYRIVYTALNNLVMAMDAMSDFSKFEFWYNKDEQENRYRMQLKMGANYVWNNIMSVSYKS